ncbi:hypothetical protein V3C99_019228 [Haemonchus contortus]
MPEMHARVLILHTSSIQKDFKKSQQNSNMDIEEELAFQKIYNVIREAMEPEAQGKRPRGASAKRLRDVIKKDLVEAKVTTEDAVDRTK